MRDKKKPTRQQRELQALLLAEQTLKSLLQFARPTQSYDFVRDPLVRITTEREVLQLAAVGDPVAVQMRRTRRAV